MRTRPFAGLLVIAMSGALACGGGGGDGGGTPSLPSAPQTPSSPATPQTPASPTDVSVGNNSFTPATITVAKGATVKWTWATCTGGSDPYYGGTGTTCVDHSVTFDDSGTGSPTQSEGTYQRAFPNVGTFTYHCVMHGTAMSGKVVVQ